MPNLTKYSERGINKRITRVDLDALSDRGKRVLDMRRVVIAAAAGQKATAVFVANTTVKHNLGPVGMPAILKAAYVSQETLVAGGVVSMRVVAYDSSANAEINLTNTLDPEVGVVREAQTFALATTNVALDADDTVELHCVADVTAISPDAQGVSVTLVWERVEETTLTE